MKDETWDMPKRPAHLHVEVGHEIDRHLHIWLRDEVLANDLCVAFALSQGGGHQDGCQKLAAHIPIQLDLHVANRGGSSHPVLESHNVQR